MRKMLFALFLASTLGAYAQDAQTSAAKITTAPTAADKVAQTAKENSVAFGLTMTDGNSDTLLGNISLLTLRVRDSYTVRLGADYAYGEDGDEKTTENAKAVAEYRHLIGSRAYLFGGLTALSDDIADIDYRVVLSAGPGFYLMKNEQATLGVEAGPAYIFEKVGGVENDEMALRVGQRYDRQLSASAKCWQALEYLPATEDFGDYLVNGEIGIEAAVNSSIALRLVVKSAYDSIPAEDRERTDTTVIAALAYQL